jgi:Membrane-associated phospholipid phosphatase
MSFLYALLEIRTPLLDTVFGLITRLGEETITIIVMCAVFWCIDKRLAYSVGVTYFISGLTVQGLKISCRIDRPWVRDPAFQPVEGSKTAATGYSFPSGHTQSAFSLFGSIGFYIKKRWLSIVCLAVAVLVGFSRMYLGVHTPADVLVGMAISVVMAWVAVKYIVKENTTVKRELAILSVLLVFCAALLIIAFVLYGSGVIDEHYVLDSCKSVGAGLGFAVAMFIERCYIKFETKCRSIWMQIIKFVLGFAGVLIIKEGLKLVVGTGLFIDTVRYFLMIVWAMAVYPLVIKKLFAKK